MEEEECEEEEFAGADVREMIISRRSRRSTSCMAISLLLADPKYQPNHEKSRKLGNLVPDNNYCYCGQ